MYFFLTPLYAVEMGLSTVAVGAVFFTAKMFDVVTDPLFGALSDKYPTPWGRRPWSVLEPSTLATSETVPFVANCLPTHRQLVPPWLAYKLIYIYKECGHLCRSGAVPGKQPGLPSLPRICSLKLHMPIEEGNAVLDPLELYWIGIIDSLVISLHVNEPVDIVLISFPFGFLARLLQQLVTNSEDSL